MDEVDREVETEMELLRRALSKYEVRKKRELTESEKQQLRDADRLVSTTYHMLEAVPTHLAFTQKQIYFDAIRKRKELYHKLGV